MTLDELSKAIEILVRSINTMLHVGFFLLMCTGLVLASGFLWTGKLTGSEWVAICGILFSADRVGHAFSAKR